MCMYHLSAQVSVILWHITLPACLQVASSNGNLEVRPAGFFLRVLNKLKTMTCIEVKLCWVQATSLAEFSFVSITTCLVGFRITR